MPWLIRSSVTLATSLAEVLRPVSRYRLLVIVLAGSLLAILATLATFRYVINRGECERACPTTSSRDLAGKLAITGFEPALEYDDGLSVRVGFVGPSMPELTSITGPGLVLNRVDESDAGTGPESLLAQGSVPREGASACTVNVWKVRPESADAYAQLPNDVIELVKGGQRVLIILDALCNTGNGP